MNPSQPIPRPGGAENAFEPLQHYLKFALFAAGDQRVMRLEELTRSDVLQPRLEQLRAEFPAARLRVLEPEWAAGASAVILGSHSSQDLDVAEAAERTLWRGSEANEFRGALETVGRLLGFPECCVRAMAGSGATRTREVETIRIGRLVRATAPPAAFHQMFSPYVPCRQDCPQFAELVASLVRQDAGGWLTRWAEAFAEPDETPAWRSWGHLAALQSLDLPGQFWLVRPVQRGRALRYLPVASFCSDPRGSALRAGDHLLCLNGAVHVLRGSERLASFRAGETFLWDPHLFWDREFWQART